MNRKVIVTAAISACTQLAQAQLDETWTLNVNGQTGRPDFTGRFQISNIPALDGAPGVPPDGWGEDLIRLTGFSTAGGITRYVHSNFFQVRSGQTVELSDLTFDFSPPPLPESVTVFSSRRLLEVDQTSELTVIAELVGDQFPNGLDVTRRLDGTVYWTSNPDIARVSSGGIVTATGLGTVYITAVNQGATGVTRIDVLPEVLDTTVEGFVIDESGAPAIQARVTAVAGGSPSTPVLTDAFGHFALPNVAFAPDTRMTVTVEKTINQTPYFGRAANLVPVNNGLTDAGIITIAPLCDPLFFSVGDSIGTAGGSGGVFAISDFASVLHVAGAFDTAGGQLANGVARWTGQNWVPLGAGMNEDVLTLAVFDDRAGSALYAGGRFTLADGRTANRVARWDGLSWSPLGSGMDDVVNTLTVHDDGSGPALYAGGRFSNAGGVTALRVARWRGGGWEPVGPGFNQEVFSLLSVPSGSMAGLIAGGSFTFIGGAGAQARRIAQWNGSAWSQIGVGLNGTVDALEMHNDGSGSKLYVGGAFTGPGSGSGTFNRIVRWSGTQWEALGSGLNQRVNTLKSVGSGASARLYVGGFFTQAGGVGANFAAVWNGLAWGIPPQGDFSDYVNTFGVVKGRLYAGGNFLRAGGVRTNGIARQDAQSWGPLGSGLNEPVDAITNYTGPGAPGIYAGGAFTYAGSQQVNYVARWNGAQWLAAGPGFDDGVFSLHQHDDGTGIALFAGGAFTHSANVAVNHVARWNGLTWQPLLGGMNGPVHAMTSYNDGSGSVLVAGGQFTTAGGATAENLAAWDGVLWREFAGGTDNTVFSLATRSSAGSAELFVGGDFTQAGVVGANRIAVWNGEAWAALGAGANDSVYALAIYDDGTSSGIHAGGSFTQIGGIAANRIAKWNGANWSTLGSGATNGVNNSVYALTSYDNSEETVLVAGGQFTTAGGQQANRAAFWNGTAWRPLSTTLGNGASNRVNALVAVEGVAGQSLFLGGDFEQAGAQPRSFITRWSRPPECGR